MLSKKIPACLCMSALTVITVPTTLGKLVKLATKVPQIIKTANDLKKSIPEIQKLRNDLLMQFQENKEPEMKVTETEATEMG